MQVESWDEANDGPLSEAALRRKLEASGYAVSRYVYPPGTYFPDHAHRVDKIDAVLSGQFRVRIGGGSIVLQAGDMIRVPKGAVHSAEVIGEKDVVSLDAVRR
jgi:quercetin dioxygenase-like cupin family protein